MTRSLALSAYLVISRLAAHFAPLVLRWRLSRGKEDRERLGERLGSASLPRPRGSLIWVHAASIGEAFSALPLIEALLASGKKKVLLTTGTVTSARQVANRLPAGAIHQFVPVDTARAVRRFLDHWSPDLAIWIESELWPRLIAETSQRGVPMALINARISARSAASWQRAPAMFKRLLGAFGVILTQDEETIDRLKALGIEGRFAGNLKALVPVPEDDESERERLTAAMQGGPVWLAASTHEGEETELLEAHSHLERLKGLPLLILAPRHPERSDALTAMLDSRGLRFRRRSQGELPGPDTDVYLADTLGEMGIWYRLAPVTFVGGSLVARGGHTPFEPVQLHSAVLHGPNVDNFAPAYRALAGQDAAVEVSGSKSLTTALETLLGDELARRRMASRALQVHEVLKPNLPRIVETLEGLMEPKS